MWVRIAVTSELALDDPQLPVLDAKNVCATIPGSADDTHVLKCVLH
uniref:Uncharacterized protein n=1 Tax=Ralstonia solanacearum TaxID=305 RepID=A0A0S4WKE2_RALSL|nr:protein of unknown function [Ralstonia solanacearum]